MQLDGTAMPAGQNRLLSGLALAEIPGVARDGGGHEPGAGRPGAGGADGQVPWVVPLPSVVGQRLDASGPLPGGSQPGKDRPARWLTASMLALAVLAAAAAVVSYAAQYRMVFAAKGVAAVAALEAAIPDVAALIFATLGIALALHGKRAIRARVLNVAAVATSVAMNVLAAGHGWRDLAVWAMPPVAYALASDTAIGVVRAWAIARQKALNEALADDEATPLAILGGLLLWLLRLCLAPASTLAGFRAWVLEECPVAPGRRGRPARREHRTADRGRARRGRSPPARRARPGGAGERGRERRPPGSWPWSPIATARSRPSRWPTCRGSAASWPRRSAFTLAPRGPRCAAMSSRCRTGAPGDVPFILARRRPAGAGRAALVFRPAFAAAPVPGPLPAAAAAPAAAPGPRARDRASSCGCGGAGSPRSAAAPVPPVAAGLAAAGLPG